MSTGKRALPNSDSGVAPKLMNATAVTGTNTYHSTTFNAVLLDNVGLRIKFVGTMAGTLTVDVSPDGSDWEALTFNPTLTQPTGSNLSYVVGLNQLPWPFVRVSYVNSTGSGTLTVVVTAKGL